MLCVWLYSSVVLCPLIRNLSYGIILQCNAIQRKFITLTAESVSPFVPCETRSSNHSSSAMPYLISHTSKRCHVTIFSLVTLTIRHSSSLFQYRSYTCTVHKFQSTRPFIFDCRFLPRDALQSAVLRSHGVCPSVCPRVTRS